MTWTTPVTAVVGQTISVSYWDTNARDNLNFLYNNSWTKISEIIPSSANNINFSSLGSYTSFAHVVIIGALRSSKAAVALETIALQINADTGANYSYSFIKWFGNASISNSSSLNNTSYFLGEISAATAPSNTFSPVYILIPEFSNTFAHKSITSSVNTKQNTSLATDLLSYENIGYWQSTAAITSIKIFTSGSNNYVSGSYLDLYGIN